MVSENSSSDTESSDGDNLTHLREAADPDLINDSMFQLAGEKTDGNRTGAKPSATLFKSQRYIADDNEHIDDLLIPDEVQKFVRKKLAKIIENRVEFVDIRSNEVTHIRTKNVTSKYDEQIKLLDDVVLQIDWDGNEMPQHSRRKRPEIKKRKLQDVDHSKTEILRLSEAVIDLQDVAKEVNNWMTKPKRTVFRYHEKNGRLFEVEEKTEFSEKRKKNNWDESKIARNKSFSK